MDELLCNTIKTDQMGFNFLDPKEKYLWSKINTSLFTQILETQKQKKMHYVGISFSHTFQGEHIYYIFQIQDSDNSDNSDNSDTF